MNRPAQKTESLKKETGDKVRLEASRLSAFHVFTDLTNFGGIHRIVSQRPLFQQVAAMLSVREVIDGLEQAGAHIGPVAVADGFNQ
jgi:hypothetical protein